MTIIFQTHHTFPSLPSPRVKVISRCAPWINQSLILPAAENVHVCIHIHAQEKEKKREEIENRNHRRNLIALFDVYTTATTVTLFDEHSLKLIHSASLHSHNATNVLRREYARIEHPFLHTMQSARAACVRRSDAAEAQTETKLHNVTANARVEKHEQSPTTTRVRVTCMRAVRGEGTRERWETDKEKANEWKKKEGQRDTER